MTDRPTSASPGPAFFGALASGLWYIAITLYIYKNDIIISPGQIIGMHIGFIFIAVVLSQYLLRRSFGADIGYRRLWLYGWMSALVLGLITGIFYKIFFSQTGEAPNIPNYFARMLITYNFFGLVISSIVALFTSGVISKK